MSKEVRLLEHDERGGSARGGGGAYHAKFVPKSRNVSPTGIANCAVNAMNCT